MLPSRAAYSTFGHTADVAGCPRQSVLCGGRLISFLLQGNGVGIGGLAPEEGRAQPAPPRGYQATSLEVAGGASAAGAGEQVKDGGRRRP